jgi:DNA invertase Pin-like site-specific DNA recombinase
MNEQLEKTEQPRGVAYSYVRFSTSKQELGDSLRRQVEMAEKYCAKTGLTLHPVSYRDLGVSAFKRKNIERGALSAFIEAVRTGKISRGSHLVIEQFDRLSRAETNKALQLLLNLVENGIKIVTLVDEKVWDETTVQDPTNLIIAIVYMSRANNESAVKAERLSSVWSEKKRRAASGQATRIVTSECPRWLAPNEAKTGFIVLHDRVESIRKVFEMRIGGYGITSIVTRANKEGWPCPGKPPVRKSGEAIEDFQRRSGQAWTWHTSTVGRLLRNRALVGEYQPYVNDPDNEHGRIVAGDPISNYYPAVLDESTFLRAQAKAARSGRFPGRRDASLKNWLQGLLRCTCGQSFVRKNKDSLAQPDYARYYCTARNRGVTKCPGASAKELETAVLTVVSTAAPQYFQGTARMEDLKARADMLEVDLSAATQMRDRYLEAIGSTKVALAPLMQKRDAAEEQIAAATKALAEIRAHIADLSGDYENVFENIVKRVRDVDSVDARAALREELSRVIEKVIVHQAEGFIEVFLRGDDKPIWQPLNVDATVVALEQVAAPDAIDSVEPFQPDPTGS